MVFNFHEPVGLLDHRHRVRADHVVAISQANQQRALVLSHVQGIRLFPVHQDKGIGRIITDQAQHLQQGRFRRHLILHDKLVNQLNHHFGISLTGKVDVRQILLL